ncbi:zf-HC2 domain-containing protein, partial [bacterium]|nr:zf-HC2 domain-containing protein [bacterium]
MNKGSFKNNGSKEPCGKIWGERISAYIDGELSQDERHEVEDHLRICPECRSFITTLERIKGVTMKMRFADPPDEIWKHYWTGIYNRIERGIGWIFFSIGL